MTSLLSPDDARIVVTTALSDADLQTIIDREEAEVVRRFGAHYAASPPITETLEGGACQLTFRRRLASVTSVTEAYYLGDTAVTLTANLDYYVFAAQGLLTRLPEGVRWGRIVAVTYVPYDDSSLRKQVIIELVRIAVNEATGEAETVAGLGYTISHGSRSAWDWRALREAQYARLLISRM